MTNDNRQVTNDLFNDLTVRESCPTVLWVACRPAARSSLPRSYNRYRCLDVSDAGYRCGTFCRSSQLCRASRRSHSRAAAVHQQPRGPLARGPRAGSGDRFLQAGPSPPLYHLRRNAGRDEVARLRAGLSWGLRRSCGFLRPTNQRLLSIAKRPIRIFLRAAKKLLTPLARALALPLRRETLPDVPPRRLCSGQSRNLIRRSLLPALGFEGIADAPAQLAAVLPLSGRRARRSP